jgi:LPS export ABC transporter protein LptC
MIRINNLLTKIFFVSIIGMLVTLISCQSKVTIDIPPDLIEKKIVPSMDAVDFETTFIDSGVVRYHLKTPRLLVFKDVKMPYKEFPEGFHLEEYDNNKKVISKLSGNYGKQFDKEGKWLATGNVVLVNIKGDTLRTEELNYSEKDDLIYTDKFVSINKGDHFIIGEEGFKSDAQMTKLFIFKTKGHVYMEDK